MSLTDALLLLSFLLANLACGGVAMFRYAQVGSILAHNHPEIWQRLQGYSFAARNAAGRFYCGLAPFRLNDPELSQALFKAWISTGFWIALAVVAFVTTVMRGLVSQ